MYALRQRKERLEDSVNSNLIEFKCFILMDLRVMFKFFSEIMSGFLIVVKH